MSGKWLGKKEARARAVLEDIGAGNGELVDLDRMELVAKDVLELATTLAQAGEKLTALMMHSR